MPGSSISLESLSSPSPSPPPSPPRAKGSITHKAQTAQAKATPPHGLGSDSELSELTEEEQDGAEKRANPPNAPHGDRTATGDESAGGTSVGGGASTSTSVSLSRRVTQTILSTTGKRRRGRKKRSSLVPAPMWDWAGTKTNKEQEEEEEEEMPGPPEVMEEEEDEDEGEEEEDKEKGAGSHRPAPTSIVRKSKGKKVASRTELGRDEAMEIDVPHGFETKLNGALALPQGVPGSGAGGNEEEEEEAESEGDSEEDKNIQSQSDDASDSDGVKWTMAPIQVRTRTPGWPHRKTNRFPHRRLAWRNPYDYAQTCSTDEKNPWKFSGDEEDDSASSKGSDEEGGEDEEDTENENEKDEGDIDKEDNNRDPPAEDVDPPDTVQVVGNYSNPIISSAALKSTSSPPNSLARVVDKTGPLVEAIAPIAAAAAASSIMAGSQVMDSASPATSTFSRLHSPDPTSKKNVLDSLKRKNAKAKEGDYDGSLSVPKVEKKEKITKHAPPALDMEVDPPELEGDGDNEPSAAVDADEPEVEQEQEVDVENELEAVEAEEPSPDDDLEVELESDLQPAHRAEALDVLATIELKFALLRERVYVEKMEGLAWEEKLVNEGTHPELIHIQKELLKRRDRRLELASRKREYELANISKKRRTNEDSTWSWWKLARDDLQTDMVAETSRKRRRLERERRASEKPQPIPHVPMPPSEVPPAPSLRKIVKSFPFIDKQKTRNSQVTPKPGDYPELLGLTPSEINTDLEVFFSGRRGYDFRGNPVIGFPASIAPPLGFSGYETYPDHMGNPIVPPGRIHPQHVPPFTHQMQPLQNYVYPSPNSGRMPPPPGHAHPLQPPPPPPPLHAGPSGSGMYPMDDIMGPIPHSLPPHHYYGSQVNGGSYPESAPPLPAPMAGPPGHHGRRSPSPMNTVVNGKQPRSGWIGPGMPSGPGAIPVGPGGYSGPGHGRSKGEWVPADDRRRDYHIGSEEEEGERMMRERGQRDDRREFFDRERDKQREHREKERDRENMMMDMDRERQMQMMAQHRQGPPVSGPPPSAPMHPHAHGMPGQHHPMVGHHSRPHHHHVVHHHHHHGASGPGGPPPPASVMHSPRASREYGEMGPGSGHGQYPTEIINLSSKLGPPPSHRDDYPSNRELDFREKESREKERARISRRSSPAPGSSSQSQSQVQGPLQPPPVESDRLISTPFAMASTQTMQASSSANGASSPHLLSAYDGHLRSPGHRFSSTGRSVPPTAGPSTPSAVPPPSLPLSVNSVPRDSSALSPTRRLPPLQSPILKSESLRERDPEGMSGSSSGASMVPSSSPIPQAQRSPGPVKFGPPPPTTLGSSTNVAERERVSSASTSGVSGAKGPFNTAVRSSVVGSKVLPGSPIGQVAKAANSQPSVNSRVGLSGSGRAGTPVEPERKGPFTSPSSARSANGAVGGFDGDERDRDKEKGKHRMLEEAKLMVGPGPLTPPTSLISSANASAPTSSPVALTSPSKMSVPQMVDGP